MFFIVFLYKEDGKNWWISKLICLFGLVIRREKVEFGFKCYVMYNEVLRKVNVFYYVS